MRRVLLIVLIFAAAGAGVAWWRLRAAPAAPATTAAGGPPSTDIPVVVAQVGKRDVPIYLDGLGTVQASATVTVKAQVDGTLTEVLVREGQDVKRGDVLARIDPRSYQAALDQQTAKKAQDEANLANARLDMARYAKLAASAYTSAQQADTARATVAQLQAQVAQDQALIDNARVQLGYTTIAAPIDGRVGIRQVDAGNLVHASDTTGIFVITTLRPISVVFTLPQQTLADVSRAMQQGTPLVLALLQGSDRGVLDRGTLAVLDNQVDQTTGTIKLKATFPNQDLKLWPGAFVTVRLQVDTVHDALVVPPVAVQRGPQGAFVYVVGDDGRAQRRPVQVGHEDLAASVLTGGVAAGERVVVDGASRLSDKTKVAVVAPEPAPGTPAPAPAPGARRAARPPKA